MQLGRSTYFLDGTLVLCCVYELAGQSEYCGSALNLR